MQSTEAVYRKHHTASRKPFFTLEGERRGSFLANAVGTGKKVIDIGCRDGALTSYFAKDNDVTGVDIDTEALARAKETLGIETMHVDLNGEWPFEKGSADAVVIAECLEHLYFPRVVLEKIADTLAADGVIAGTVPHAYSIQNRLRYLMGTKKNTPLSDPTHINQFSVPELRGLLEERFENVVIEGITGKRLSFLATLFPLAFAAGLLFRGSKPRGVR